MLMTVSFLTLLNIIPFAVTIFRSCAPNTKFLLNGRLCLCNNLGQFNDASCQLITRKQLCQPGQIIWEQCSQCICQENGKYICTNSQCSEDIIKPHTVARSLSSELCTPFKSYFINCSLCVCPATGQMTGARCAKDSSCTLKNVQSFESIAQNICIPKVMYLFNCLRCLCSDDGKFHKSKCTETCRHDSRKKCMPKSFYRSHCNICYCPNNGIQDKNLCSNLTCHRSTKMKSLQRLRGAQYSCTTNKFTKAKCIYCECNSRGSINEQSCMEQECLKTEFSYDIVKSKCSRGEMVLTCMECFCPRSNLTTEKYCTKGCSLQRRIAILENALMEKVNLIDRSAVKDIEGTDSCDPESLYLDQGRYCLCSADGDTSLKQCTSVMEQVKPKSSKLFVDHNVELYKTDLNISCEPNSYIEIGCNTCYCNQHGKVDPKWCTNDDCEAKKIVLENNKKKTHTAKSKTPNGVNTTTCVPGSISRFDCNFCICSNSGLTADRVCTKNICDGHQNKAHNDEQHCDPLTYYLAGCNICYCPSDGIKNVNKCTKNQCEDNFLRSNACKPGDLFSDDCEICVCPPNGDKRSRICTNRTCDEYDMPWKKIFKISRPILSNHIPAVPTKNFEPCFPGEEFEMGCKVCVCPEMGLKEYATCTTILCNEPSIVDPTREEMGVEEMDRFKEDRYDDNRAARISRVRRQQVREDDISDENCRTFNITDGTENKLCTPGSEYIIKCKICICPYIGSISQFCRPMPVDRYCEQAYPGFNFAPMARRNIIKANSTAQNATAIQQNITQIYIPHNHTKYSCQEPGVISNDCHICKCEDKVLIEEHCFKSDAPNCANLTEPTFLKSYRRVN